MIVETLFEDENDYEYGIWIKVFCVLSNKKKIPESVIVLFCARKVSTAIIIEGGWDLSRLKNAKTSKIL